MNPKNEHARQVTHLPYLDAARGIAALSVMAYHFINWKYEDRLAAKLGSIVMNGSDAVSFFFVLSGFVLSYQYLVLDRRLPLASFYINRFFRLWPAFFITVFINALNWSRADLTVSNLVNTFIFNTTKFWNEALLIRAHPHYFTPSWTLSIELCISFMIPFFVLLARSNTRVIIWLLFVSLLIGGIMGHYYMFHFHFLLGVMLSCLFVQLSQPPFKETAWYRYRYPLLAAAAVLYSVRHIGRIFPPPASYTTIATYLGIDYFHYTAVASFILLVFIIQSPRLQLLLQNRLLLFMGKISYGIYLMHWLLVTDIFVYWDRINAAFPNTKIALSVSFAGYTAVTLVLATVIHFTVELPFIRLGKRLTARLKGGTSV